MKECLAFLSVFMGAGGGLRRRIWALHGSQYGVEFFTGWLIEYSLSVDNLFVFIILMTQLAVPRQVPAEALMVGIVLALVFRGIFIALGYTLVENSAGSSTSSALPHLHGLQARPRTTTTRGAPRTDPGW